MLGDVAVALNPQDERYKHFKGKKLSLPLSQREIPIIGGQKSRYRFRNRGFKDYPRS